MRYVLRQLSFQAILLLLACDVVDGNLEARVLKEDALDVERPSAFRDNDRELLFSFSGGGLLPVLVDEAGNLFELGDGEDFFGRFQIRVGYQVAVPNEEVVGRISFLFLSNIPSPSREIRRWVMSFSRSM